MKSTATILCDLSFQNMQLNLQDSNADLVPTPNQKALPFVGSGGCLGNWVVLYYRCANFQSIFRAPHVPAFMSQADSWCEAKNHPANADEFEMVPQPPYDLYRHSNAEGILNCTPQ